MITALTLSGLPTDRFLFAGFLPNTATARKTALRGLSGVPATLALYESPKRVAAMLRDAASVLGPDRQAAVCRELTKKFEEVLRGTLSELAADMSENPRKGEMVVLIDRAGERTVNLSDIEEALRAVMNDMSVRDAADAVSHELGLKRRQVYQIALKLGGEEGSG